MAKRAKSDAFDVKLTPEERKELASDLCAEIEDALSARSAMIADGGLIDLFDWFYEQGRSDKQDLPFPGAADLTSYIITENVDAMKARLMKAVFGVKPFCFVEGWGADAKKAPYVEAFMDWQVRKSPLRLELGKTIQGALIEDCYILEVSEKVETRRHVETIDVAVETDPATGAPLFADGRPILRYDDEGEPVLAQQGEPAARGERETTKTKRLGPKYTPISMKDFGFLPGHAKHMNAVWGYFYRFSERVPELQEKAKDGIYDRDAVRALGEESDRELTQPTTSVADVAPQTGPSSEKELFQLFLKRDLDKDGREEWYVATLSLPKCELLRLKLDKFVMKVGRPRCVPFVLYPRRNAVYGYSYAGDKLLTLAEEHTGIRNIRADRSAIATNAPIKVMQNALWDPDAQPFGPGRTIPVRNMGEVEQLIVSDVPPSVTEQEHLLMNAKERVGGLSDVAAIGTRARQSNTLGQDQMISQASAVRVDEVIGYLHAAITEVLILSHAIWVETLEADTKGLEAPQSVLASLTGQQLALPGDRFTAEQLKGNFTFEPYGSDDSADPARRQAKFNNKFAAIANVGKAFPAVGMQMQTPEAAKAIIEEWAREYDVRDIKPFVGSLMAPQIPPGAGPGAAAPMGAPDGGLDPELQQILDSLAGGGLPADEGDSGGY